MSDSLPNFGVNKEQLQENVYPNVILFLRTDKKTTPMTPLRASIVVLTQQAE
jgi:hypothetical protein